MDNTIGGKTTHILKGSQSKALISGQSNTVRAQRGEHYRVVKKNAAGEESMQDDVIARKLGDHLLLSYADGTQLTLENYYVQCKAGDCDLTLPSSDLAGFKVSADGAPGAALADGSTLSYAYGSPSILMIMAQGDAALGSTLAGLEGSQATYIPSAGTHSTPSSFGGSGLLAALGGLGMVAAAGGSGSNSNPLATPSSVPAQSSTTDPGTTNATSIVLKGQITVGPSIAGNGLQVEVFQADGKTSLGTTQLNADGTFSLGVAGYSGVVIIKVKDTNPTVADYIDEATGQAKNLDTLLMAVAIASNGTVTANVNPITTIAALKAGLSSDGTFADKNATKISVDQVTAANAGVASAFGLENILTNAAVTTVTGSATANSSFNTVDGISQAETYGALLAALSGLGKTQGTTQSIERVAEGIDITGRLGTVSSTTQSLLLDGARTAADNPNSAGRDVLVEIVASAIRASATPSISEVELANAVLAIKDAADANNAVTTLTASTFSKAGVTGVSDINLASILSALDSTTVNSIQVSSTSKIQDLVNAYAAILSGADGNASNNNAGASAAQYRLVGVTGMGAASATLLNDVVDGKHQADIATVAQLQTLADAANAVISGAGGSTAPTLQQLTLLGIKDVNVSNLKAVQAAIAASDDTGAGVDTLAELQALVTAVPPGTPVLALGTDTGSLGTDGVTKDGTIKLSNLEEGSTWQYSTDGKNWFDGSGTSFTLRGEGEQTVRVRQTDAGGKQSEEASLTFTLDTVAPKGPTVNAVGTDNTINASEWASFTTISGTCEEGAIVTINGFDNSNITVNGTTWTYTLTQNDLNFLLGHQDTLPISYDSKGEYVGYSLLVTQTDAAGNTSETKTFVFTVDTKAPVIGDLSDIRFTDNAGNITGSIASNSTSDDTTPTLSGQAMADVARVNVYDGSSLLGFADVTDGTWTFTPSSDLTEGRHSFSVKAVDAAGNEANDSSASLTLTIDTTISKPTLALLTDSGAYQNDSITNSAVLVLSRPASDVTRSFQIGTGQASSSYTAPTTDGTYTVTVTDTDTAGNSSSKALTFTLDTDAPNAPSTDVVAGDNIVNAREWENFKSISGTCEEGATVTFKDEFGLGDFTIPVKGTTWTYTFSHDRLVDDSFHINEFANLWDYQDNSYEQGYNFVVTQTDTAGNTSEQGHIVFKVDTHAPKFNSGDHAEIHGGLAAGKAAYLATVDSEISSSRTGVVPSRVETLSWSLQESGDWNLFKMSESVQGEVDFKLSADHYTESDYTFTVIASDLAGNQSQQLVHLHLAVL